MFGDARKQLKKIVHNSGQVKGPYKRQPKRPSEEVEDSGSNKENAPPQNESRNDSSRSNYIDLTEDTPRMPGSYIHSPRRAGSGRSATTEHQHPQFVTPRPLAASRTQNSMASGRPVHPHVTNSPKTSQKQLTPRKQNTRRVDKTYQTADLTVEGPVNYVDIDEDQARELKGLPPRKKAKVVLDEE